MIELDGGVGIDSPTYTGDGSGLSGTGKVLQVIQVPFTGTASVSSGTAVSVGHTISITPSSATSKILVTYNFHWGQKKSINSNQDNIKYWTIYKIVAGVANQIIDGGHSFGHQNEAGSIDFNEQTQQSTIEWLDSPNTTQEVTYDLRTWTDNSSQITIEYNQRGWPSHKGCNTVTVMEIGA